MTVLVLFNQPITIPSTAAAFATITVEAELTTGKWYDITDDVRAEQGIHLRRGIQGNSPLDRVASTGTLGSTLDNSQANRGASLGFYSPDNIPNRLLNWEIGKRVHLIITYGGPYYKFLGKMDSIIPSAGVYGSRSVDVTAVDYMDELATHKIGMISAQTDKSGDALLAKVVISMPNWPEDNSFDTGSDVYSYGLHSEKDETTTGMTAAQKIAQSGMDDVYVTGDFRTGETLHYRSRHGRILNTTSVATFDNTMTGLKIKRGRESLYNNINVVYYPVRRDTEPVILYSLSNEIQLGPGESTTFTVRYTDPLSAAQRVSSDQMITPVMETDYKMAKHSGGLGTALTSYLTVVTKDDSGTPGTFGYNSCDVTLTNTHPKKTGFINFFHLRGYGIYTYDPITLSYVDSTSQGKYGDRPLKYDMYYQQNGNVATDFLGFFKAHYLDPVSSVDSIEFIANTNDYLMTAAMVCDVGSRITVVETLTGISTDYFVQGYALDISAGGFIKCTLGPLARTDIGGPYGQIGNATYGKIGDTFKIGY